MDSLDKDFCLQKLDSAIALVQRILDGDHPHRDSHHALERILSVYKDKRAALLSLDDTAQSDTILEHCRLVNIALVRFKPLLGFLLRSTNLRNAFELYFPIRILASELLNQSAHIVLGSEWDFSPYTYPMVVPELPDFVFIGIPASECQNPLILPLAGHELGHVVWNRKGAESEFEPKVRARTIEIYKANWEELTKLFHPTLPPDRIEEDLFLIEIWGKSYALALRQLEEIFCDFVGLFAFGQSFLHSFRYFLAPSLGRNRSPYYPPILQRAKYIMHAAEKYDIPKIDNFVETFNENEPKLSPNDTFIVKMADNVTEQLFPELIELVEKYKGSAERFSTGTSDEDAVVRCLRSLVPPVATRSISAIVNAAWQIRLHLDQWKILENVENQNQRREQKLRVLRDLVLKSFEVYEYRKRLEKNAA